MALFRYQLLALCSVIPLGFLMIGCSRSGDAPLALDTNQTDNSLSTTVAVDESSVEADLPDIPRTHQSLLDVLQKSRTIQFDGATADECLADLSKSLGVEIRLHEELRPAVTENRLARFQVKTPVSHQTGLRITMMELGVHDAGLVFEEDHLLVVAADYPKPALRTINLRDRADFSLAKRESLMRQAVGSVHSHSWGGEAETWIQAGESVFHVDVYQTPVVHADLTRMLQTSHHYVIIDEDVQSLQVFPGVPGAEVKPVDTVRVVERLREKYPYESLVDRLDYEDTARRQRPYLSPESEKRLSERDSHFAAATAKSVSHRAMRAESLRMLHEEEVSTFVGRPGAGLARMPSPGPYYLPRQNAPELPLASRDEIPLEKDMPVQLPPTRQMAAARRVYLPSVQTMEQFHFSSEQSFVDPTAFGYVKDRSQVAGFSSHGMSHIQRVSSFRRRPWYTRAEELWAICRMELVSLLKHEEPVVYISRNAPRMEELREAKTRPLNDFEKSGLQELLNGRDVVLNSSLNRIEMLGALRAAKECLQCHRVERGALLGVFSYELLRDPQIDPDEVPELNSQRTLTRAE